MSEIVYSTQTIISDFFSGIVAFIPQLLAGLILLIIGLIVGNIVKGAIKGLSRLLMIDSLMKKIRLDKTVSIGLWMGMIAEVIRWSIVVLFLVAAVEAWGLTQVGSLLSQLLVYLPNVFIAVVIGFIGMVAATIVRDIIMHSAKGLGSASAGILSTIAWYAVVAFTSLLILNQLGIGADLVKILFTGIVAMLALAGGLAFGLGGKDMAQQILNELYKKTRD
jgi:hypothetical protein